MVTLPVYQKDVWYHLDNAANLFPSVSGDKNTNVFRLSFELREPIDRDTLQQALDAAVKAFPYFRVVMRRGLFWFYLERTALSPVVEQENERPCSRIFYKNIKKLLFRVNYYGRRINLEVFHAVSDGGGALDLLKTIVYHYIVLTRREELPSPLPPAPGESSPEDKAEDSFEKHYVPKKKNNMFRQRAYSIGGTALPAGNIKVIEAHASTKAILRLAKAKGATATAYLAALLLLSVYQELMPRRAAGKTIALTVPVDLRGRFSSRSARNFFSVVNVGYNFSKGPADFDSVLASVCEQLASSTQDDELASRISYTMGVRKNWAARFTPLIVKNWILRAAYNKVEKASTCALSNMGRITMPKEFIPYIERFSCLLNPTSIHKVKLTLSSFEDEFVMAFTSGIAETGAQTYFIRHLTQNGVDVMVTCNGGYDDEIL